MSYNLYADEKKYYGVDRRANGTLPTFEDQKPETIAGFIRNYFLIPGETLLDLVLKDSTAIEIARKAYEKGNPGTQNGFDEDAMPRRVAELIRTHCTKS